MNTNQILNEWVFDKIPDFEENRNEKNSLYCHLDLNQTKEEHFFTFEVKDRVNKFIDPVKVTEITFGQNKADIITILDGLHRLQYQGLFINDLTRIIKLGGLLFIEDYDVEDHQKNSVVPYLDLIYIFNKLLVNEQVNYEFINKYYRRYISFFEIKKLLEKVGFQLIRYYSYDNVRNPQKLYFALYVFCGGKDRYSDIKLPSRNEFYSAKKNNLLKWINFEKKKITKLECNDKESTIYTKNINLSEYYYAYIEKTVYELFNIDSKLLNNILWLLNGYSDLYFFQFIKDIGDNPNIGIINNWKNVKTYMEQLAATVSTDLSKQFNLKYIPIPIIPNYQNSPQVSTSGSTSPRKSPTQYSYQGLSESCKKMEMDNNVSKNSFSAIKSPSTDSYNKDAKKYDASGRRFSIQTENPHNGRGNKFLALPVPKSGHLKGYSSSLVNNRGKSGGASNPSWKNNIPRTNEASYYSP